MRPLGRRLAAIARHVALDRDTRLPWQVWNEVVLPDGMAIYDPDGFRGGKPTIVTWAEFVQARNECTLVPR